jgi:hypothetical protein
MLHVYDELLHCYNMAERCEWRAAAARNADDQDFWMERAAAWIHLAESYQFARRMMNELKLTKRNGVAVTNVIVHNGKIHTERGIRDYPLCSYCAVVGKIHNWFSCDNCGRTWQ